MSKVKVGIIGCGSISNVHIRSYLKNPNVELAAFCDINEERLKSHAEKYGAARLFTSKEEMFAKIPDLSAVSVCTWNAAHSECAIAALDAGCSVLVEKPMAMNGAEARAMKAAAARNNKLLMIGFSRRHGNSCKIVKELADAGYFGDIYYAKASYLRRCGFPGGWFGDKSRSGGGPLIDLGVHIIDLARFLMGNLKPASVYGATFSKLGKRKDIKKINRSGYFSASKGENDAFDVEDLATAMIRFENGAILSVEASFSLNIKSDGDQTSLELFGTKAGARLDPEFEIYSDLGGYMANLSFPNYTASTFDGLFEAEIGHFIDCAQNGEKCMSPAEDGIALMDILDAIYESARTGHEVVLP